ncbi:hypothetical protein AOXY_G38694 [Acipenser oxyrinchus oxyrinchus]|uniref:Uncharacterized protein n=1 Tax=Acipenser oxyrinchus oxyrinchus TaxID=40147 RepID=A0AAD8FQ14_ACIOX|nr:hypothetical protein AOXY_G38694 [Acipenser oxyrinchus oxyrinchus]
MEPEPNRDGGTSGEKTEPPTPPQPPPNHEEAAAAAAAAACGDATVTSAVALSPAAPGRVLRDRTAGRTLTAAALSASEVRSPGGQTQPHGRPGSGRVLRERTGRGSGESKSRASPASGLQSAAAVVGDGPAAAAAARRRKAEYPRRRRNAGARGESAEDAEDDSGLTVDSEDTKNSAEKGKMSQIEKKKNSALKRYRAGNETPAPQQSDPVLVSLGV